MANTTNPSPLTQTPQVVFHGHLGLGDLFICNGLIREWCRTNPDRTLLVPVRPPNWPTAAHLLADVQNAKLLTVPTRPFLERKVEEMARQGVGVINANRWTNPSFNEGEFDQEFYRIAEVDFRHKWDSFSFPSYREPVLRVPASLIRSGFTLVHQDPRRGFMMRTQLFQDRWPIVSLGDLQSPDLLRVTEFIKGAVEIHVIDSCLLNLLDCWSYEPRHPSQKLIYHRYAKGAGYQPPTVIKKKWLTIQ